METKEFKKLEAKLITVLSRIQGARKAYYEEMWLTEKMYKQIFLETVEELKKAMEE